MMTCDYLRFKFRAFIWILLLGVTNFWIASPIAHAQDSSTLTKEEKEQIEKRKQARTQVRSRLSQDKLWKIDQSIINILRNSSEDADPSLAIRGALESGADPDGALINVYTYPDTTARLAQNLSILLEYGADVKKMGLPTLESKYYLDYIVFFSNVSLPISLQLLRAAAQHSVKKDDLNPLKDLIEVFKKYGIVDLKFKVYIPHAIGTYRAHQCTIAGLAWELFAFAKKVENQELCEYYKQTKDNNLQFLKNLAENLFTFDLTEKYKNISNDWKDTRKSIARHREFWGKSIQRSNFFGSIAMALDPEHKSKCEKIEEK